MIRRVYFRKALSLKSLILLEISLKIRLAHAKLLQEGADKEADRAIFLACLAAVRPELVLDPEALLSSPDLDDQEKDIARKNRVDRKSLQESFDKYYETTKSVDFDQLKADHSSCQAFIEEHLEENSRKQYFIDRAMEYSKKSELVGMHNVHRIYDRHKKVVTDLRDLVSDREAVKISLFGTNVTAIVAVVTPLVALSGYVYVTLVLSVFGVEAADYFDLSEYLSSSVAGIGPAIFATLASAAMMFFGLHSASRKPFAQIEAERSRKEYLPYVLGVMAVFTLVMSVRSGGYLFINALFITGFALIFNYLPKFTRKYFEEFHKSVFVLFVICVFALNLVVSILRTVEEVRKKEAGISRVVLSDGTDVAREAVPILSNARYIFLWRSADDVTLVYPTSQIAYTVTEASENHNRSMSYVVIRAILDGIDIPYLPK